MDFSQILDGIIRPAKAEETPWRAEGAGRSPEFWQVLERIGDAPPVSDQALKDAYFAEDFKAAASSAREEAAREEPTEEPLSVDPDDIAYELGLSDVVSLEELSTLRRRFAMLNHPDRTTSEQRERATTRMTLANAMIDAAARRLSR
ncbi:MAG: hypothetical protein H7Y08_04230 [Rhizobiaceae bacterium]|nr:hypothetical protein [Rhizobiaceae bacterium]